MVPVDGKFSRLQIVPDYFPALKCLNMELLEYIKGKFSFSFAEYTDQIVAV